MLRSTHNNLSVFNKLCGKDAFTSIVLGTKRWSDIQGSPGISEITRGRFFFLSHPGHPPPPLSWYSKKNIYEFGIYYSNSVPSSMRCVVSLLNTPVKLYAHALCVHGVHNAIFSVRIWRWLTYILVSSLYLLTCHTRHAQWLFSAPSELTCYFIMAPSPSSLDRAGSSTHSTSLVR